MARSGPKVKDLIFVGFNSRIVALERDSGRLVWKWKSPSGSGYVALLLDGEWLIASVNGYTYGLDARTGSQMWANELKGLGTGVPCMASLSGTTNTLSLLAEADAKAQEDSNTGGA
jgi:outer membrane protein assembly factor BamB